MLREQEEDKKEQKRVERIYALNKEIFLKNKFIIYSDSMEGQNLSGWF